MDNANGVTIATITQIVYKQAYIDAIGYALAVTTVAAGGALILVRFMKSKKIHKTDVALQE